MFVGKVIWHQLCYACNCGSLIVKMYGYMTLILLGCSIQGTTANEASNITTAITREPVTNGSNYECLDGERVLVNSTKDSYMCSGVLGTLIIGSEQEVILACDQNPKCNGYDYRWPSGMGRLCRQSMYPGLAVKFSNFKLCKSRHINTTLVVEYKGQKLRFPLPDYGTHNGVFNVQGHIEIYHNGTWGGICSNSFDTNDAHVICKMFGYSFGHYKSSYHQSFGAPMTNKIWLDDLHCIGNETDISDCPHNVWGGHNCFYFNMVGIRCYGKVTPVSHRVNASSYRCMDGEEVLVNSTRDSYICKESLRLIVGNEQQVIDACDRDQDCTGYEYRWYDQQGLLCNDAPKYYQGIYHRKCCNSKLCKLLDANECVRRSHSCHKDATCTNTFGSYTCTCNAGFTGSGITCTEINKCLYDDMNDCSEYATCTQHGVDFTCKCNGLLFGNGTYCHDPCNTTLPCPQNSTCINLGNNTKSCRCNDGFFYNNDIDTCMQMEVSYRVKIKIMNIEFHEDLNNPESELYIKTAQKVEGEVLRLLKTKIMDAVAVKVVAFSNGSVISEFLVIMNGSIPKRNDTTDLINQALIAAAHNRNLTILHVDADFLTPEVKATTTVTAITTAAMTVPGNTASVSTASITTTATNTGPVNTASPSTVSVSTTVSPAKTQTRKSESKAGVIAGSVVGAIVGIIILVFLVYFITKRYQQRCFQLVGHDPSEGVNGINGENEQTAF